MTGGKTTIADVVMALVIALFNPLALAVWLLMAMWIFR